MVLSPIHETGVRTTMRLLLPTALAAALALFALSAYAADEPIKTFILAGQSNMVGWGESTRLTEDLRKGNDRVVMFENGKWQPLRPHEPANRGQRRVGLTEFHFGPEIAFGHEMAKAWPGETIGIIKFAIGGTSLLAWKPDWSRQDADRVGQGRLGSLYKRLMEKVDQAKTGRDIEIVGFLWLQGGGDMKNAEVAKEYLDNLKSLVAAVRKQTGVADLPFLYGSGDGGLGARTTGISRCSSRTARYKIDDNPSERQVEHVVGPERIVGTRIRSTVIAPS